MLLGGYRFRLVNISCLPSSTLFNVLVDLDDDIGEALPFLNAVVAGGHYVHGERVYDFMHDGHIITLLPRNMKVTGVADADEAARVVAWLRDEINRVWEARAGLVPSYETRPRRSPVDVLRELPRTNCRQCGVPTCLAFATLVVRGLADPAGCPHRRAGAGATSAPRPSRRER